MTDRPQIVFTAYENEPDIWETILTNHPNSETEIRVVGRSLVGRLTDDTGPADRILLDWLKFSYDDTIKTLSIIFTPLQDQLDDLLEEIHTIEDRVSGDEDRIEALETAVGVLQSTVVDLQSQIDVLNGTVVSLQTQITQILQLALVYPYGSAGLTDFSKLTASSVLRKASSARLSGGGSFHGALYFYAPIGATLTGPLSRFKMNPDKISSPRVAFARLAGGASIAVNALLYVPV